jgi:hypothetical protein
MVDTNRHKTANRMEFLLTGVSFLLAKTTMIVRLFRLLATCEQTSSGAKGPCILELANLTPGVLELLRITHLTQMFSKARS